MVLAVVAALSRQANCFSAALRVLEVVVVAGILERRTNHQRACESVCARERGREIERGRERGEVERVRESARS